MTAVIRTTAIIQTPSPPLGAERVGVRWGIPEHQPRTHLTLPALRAGPLPLPPEGRRGMFASIRGSQPDGKGRAFPEGAGDIEPAAVAVEDMLDDRQAEAGPAQFARSGIVD